MKYQTLFTVGNAVLLMFCTFVWGAQLSNVLTGNLSPLAFSFVSLSIVCVIVVVFIAGRRRGIGSLASNDSADQNNKPSPGG